MKHVIHAARPALLEVAERGQDLRVSSSHKGESPSFDTPPRFGVVYLAIAGEVTIEISRSKPGTAAGVYELRMDCDRPPFSERRIDWLRELAKLEPEVREPRSEPELRVLLEELFSLVSRAPTPFDRAFALHCIAQAHFISGRSSDASEAFLKAVDAWLLAGERDRALAALVGRTEDLQRAGRYRDVLDSTRYVSGLPDHSRYFGVRLENSRCLAFQYLGRWDDAASCYRGTIKLLEAMGEELELISTLQDYAQLRNAQGHWRQAAELAQRASRMISAPAWDSVPAPGIPIVRGRVHRLLAELALDRGDIAQALRESLEALAAFKLAKSARWEANTYLRVAQIYSELGALDDARANVDLALGLLSEKDAPARVATAWRTLAEIEAADDRPVEAERWAAAAMGAFERLSMPSERTAAALLRAESALVLGKADRARELLDALGEANEALEPRTAIVRARIALGKRDLPTARRFLEKAKKGQTTLSDWIRLQLARAELSSTAGDAAAAQALLEQTLERVDALAMQAGNPLMRLLIRRRQELVESAAIGLELDAAASKGRPMSEMADRIWAWLSAQAADVEESAAQDVASATAFDRSVARILLPMERSAALSTRTDATAAEHLLRLLTERGGQGKAGTAQPVPLRQMQDSLPPGTALFAVGEAGDRIVTLWADGDFARVAWAPIPRREFAARQRQLVENAARPEVRVSDIRSDVEEVSKLFAGVEQDAKATSHLIVLATNLGQGTPWSLLRLPGTDHPLVSSTATTIARIRQPDAAAARHGKVIHVLLANPGGVERSALPTLRSIDSDYRLIVAATAGRGWQVLPTENASRQDLLKALTSSGWVHIGAHGSSDAGYIGRAGFWVRGSGDSAKPDIVTWVDVLGRTVAADTLVLGACDLGAPAESPNSTSIGFADALMRSGAENVVAARWPVSDTATAVWLPILYSRGSTAPDSPDPLREMAMAVREAQNGLRNSRMFRHPSQWASFMHFAAVSPARLAARAVLERAPK